MGIENRYEAQVDFTCECRNNITATFEVWEYPIGVQNYQKITIDDAELIGDYNPEIDFSENRTIRL